MKLLQTLAPFIALFLILLANNVLSQSTTTSFSFDSVLSEPTQLTFQGDAHVPSGSRFLRLTKTDASGNNPQTWSVGRVLYSTPVQFWNARRQATFETTIRFLIKTVDNNPGDGIAFFIAPVNSTIPSGSGGGNLGIFNSSGTGSSIFAVEFDIYSNSPYDPSFRHIGIDANSRISRRVASFENMLGQVVTARINYEPITRTLRVVAISGTHIITVRYFVDLRSILTQQVQVGISASTGGAVAVHDIHSWHFTSTLA